MSFGERNWHGIVRGQGYVRVLAGWARSDNPRLTPPLIPPLTQRKNFCTTRLLFQNRSFVDFTEKSEHLDVRWGRSSRNRPFYNKEMRSALMFFGSNPFTLWKSIICRFYKSKRGLWGRSSRKWLFSLSKTHSGRMFFISFLTSGPKTYHWSVLRPEVRNENVGSPLGELSAAVRIKHLAKKSRIVL